MYFTQILISPNLNQSIDKIFKRVLREDIIMQKENK
jgi:hypothetical protein